MAVFPYTMQICNRPTMIEQASCNKKHRYQSKPIPSVGNAFSKQTPMSRVLHRPHPHPKTKTNRKSKKRSDQTPQHRRIMTRSTVMNHKMMTLKPIHIPISPPSLTTTLNLVKNQIHQLNPIQAKQSKMMLLIITQCPI
jgi:hypothetical protein